MAKIYIVDLSKTEREFLVDITGTGHRAARKIKRAHMLLLAHQGKTDPDIANVLQTSIPTVERTRKRFVEGGLDLALNEQSRAGRRPKVDDKFEAILTTLAQSLPPHGRQCWTLQLLADRLVELKVIEQISDETVRRVLKKTS